MKTLILACFIISLSTSSAQNFNLFETDNSKFVSIKTLNENQKLRIIETVIITNDTLVKLKDKISEEDLKYMCACFKNDTITKIYRNMAFTRKVEGYSNSETSQWTSNIIVYFDSKFSKKIKKEFKAFFKPVEKINNLNIFYTNRPNKANYHIKVSDTIIKNHKNDEDILDETQPFSRITYNLISDNNHKYYAGKIFIDVKNISDKTLIIKKLKQLFFNSLGHFQLSYFSISANSLTKENYTNSLRISETDIALLKLHYFKIHHNSFSLKDFLKLENELKNTCTYD
ncbi:hypothetical protein [Winogradskyella wichelsiae]|uniref:hypothetical protein n=1 Tax=Winogradskyella wichelsiae TaxID=2697007 RepID=UPI003EF117A4